MLLFLCFVSCNNDESCCFFVSIVNIVLISAAGDVLLSWVSMQLLTYHVEKRKGELYFDHDVGLCVNSETAPYFLSISLVSALFLVPLIVSHPLSSFFSFLFFFFISSTFSYPSLSFVPFPFLSRLSLSDSYIISFSPSALSLFVFLFSYLSLLSPYPYSLLSLTVPLRFLLSLVIAPFPSTPPGY